ncbi:MAG: hypothetical protein IPM82_08755 [Saprospiraceae bacterium]|nr:hypothetical protein [Saprospiraceae bacterium]
MVCSPLVLQPGAPSPVQFSFSTRTTAPIYLAQTMLTKGGTTISATTSISGESIIKPVKVPL